MDVKTIFLNGFIEEYSTTEVKFIAAVEATKEAVWIKKFITELGIVPSIADSIPLYCDNNRAIAHA